MTWKIPDNMTARKAEKEAERLAYAFEQKLQSGYNFDPHITFAEFSVLWQKEYASKQHRNTTIAREEALIGRINTHLGNIRPMKLHPQHIRDFMNMVEEKGMRKDRKYVCLRDLPQLLRERKIKVKDFINEAHIAHSTYRKAAKGEAVSYGTVNVIVKLTGLNEETDFRMVSGGGKYSGKTLMHYYRLISKILSDAMRWGYAQDNPCRMVIAPKIRKKKVDFLDDRQVQVIILRLLLIQFDCLHYGA
jgi:hypothetical protein